MACYDESAHVLSEAPQMGRLEARSEEQTPEKEPSHGRGCPKKVREPFA